MGIDLPTSPISVDQLSATIKDVIESIPGLSKVAVRGEISDIKRHSSGHCYFTLAGKDSRISAVLFRSDASSVVNWPRIGDEVVVGGRISTYPQRGTYQLYARRMMPIGKGAADRARQETMDLLSKEGLFDQARKKAIPPYPRRVCCITSPTGAAVRDVLKVSGERNPSLDVVIVPCTVQGIDAPDTIVKALSRATRLKDIDVVLLVRGGGSKDDLVPFDDPDVVRAVASCPVPVVTGIGHEVDVSLSDLASDLRCATPSEAAEASIPHAREIRSHLSNRKDRLLRSITDRMFRSNVNLGDLSSRLDRGALRSIDVRRSQVDMLERRLDLSTRSKIASQSHRLASLASSLFGMSPMSVLGRRFLSCRDIGGVPVTSISAVSKGDMVILDLVDGVVECEVKSISSVKRGGRKDGPRYPEMG
ncbi:MAG: exodeoxyribonuclease VII large subunit [Dethiosulfovibrio sp.]|nr:exodeoxyribonuclease VII large subunit [Dethiosulfovibrio sp.]